MYRRPVIYYLRILLLLSLALLASAADRTISQFVHRSWTRKDGAPVTIYAITQTPDRFLWLGAAEGLFRFDGYEFEHYQPQSGDALPARGVAALLARANGELWVAFLGSGVSVLHNGHNQNHTTADRVPTGTIVSFAEDQRGVIWAAASRGGLARFDGNKWTKVGVEDGFGGQVAAAVNFDHHGTLWVASDSTIFYLRPGATRFQATGIQIGQVREFLESPGGTLWMAETSRSVRPVPLPVDSAHLAKDAEIKVGAFQFLFDREGSLWINTLGDGLRRVALPDLLAHEKIQEFSHEIEIFTTANGLTADYCMAIYQDREGNVWVGTSGGLDRFTKSAVAPVAVPGRFGPTILVPGDDGDTWVASLSAQIGWVHENNWSPMPTKLSILAAFRDPDAGTWWLLANHTLNRERGHRFAAFPYPRDYDRVSVLAIDHERTVWIGSPSGLAYRRDGIWRRFVLPEAVRGKAPTVTSVDGMGRVWIGYRENTILVLDKTIPLVYAEPEGLQLGTVKAIDVHPSWVWAAGTNGLQLFDGKRFRNVLPAGNGEFGSVSGVLETSDGCLWLNSFRGILRILPDEVSKLKAGADRVSYAAFDAYDGLPGETQQTALYPTLVRGTEGPLWFATTRGPVWVDPNDLPKNDIPPPVVVSRISANGKQYSSFADLRLPPLTRDLEITYTALSYAIPEHVRYRYRLEGSENNWQEAGTRRQAFYTNLGPGSYRFRVAASNNDGIWNDSGFAVTFRVIPAFYQAIWFQALCYTAGLALAWIFYLSRVKQAAVEVSSRLAERERIARELHDTLLQGFQGSLFQFQAARKLLFRRPEEALRTLDEAISSAQAAITEGREATCAPDRPFAATWLTC
jgi:ligand-binding sensor domain-containing protein